MPVSQPPSTRQAVTGLVPPEIGEAHIREVWPTLLGVVPTTATVARRLTQTVLLAPVAWIMLAPAFALKFAPFVCRRYTLTNRRLMIQKGLMPKPSTGVALRDIDSVRVVESTRDEFYLSATLEVLSGDRVVLTLPGVPEPEGFRRAVLSAVSAWGGKPATPFVPATVKR